ncbi:hypothetical protein CAOG_03634 [Capsaspora owczarzaki ATCC 30864]|uniref:Membrane insertase YidC/Oxa/ALB C-terminal domain-containing protein n=1 Tax=Capsaspora owczarzaki (strain ATCC 30864) TaxID=595528 RepID=A0A0D2X2K5_CAPO3|nr:hypothetical protein CAOG_03634 [Capsaspora owczarzaki ATCC 30864]KJE92719.1 hypothetical protein CAOG_003634 [Capsaspora owczarzaki ATCC 30864]|eukprot:XP_004363362.2 hypothetical protein CAOG_03634 [Capsaspora owczarzaki ATCC 30864]
MASSRLAWTTTLVSSSRTAAVVRGYASASASASSSLACAPRSSALSSVAAAPSSMTATGGSWRMRFSTRLLPAASSSSSLPMRIPSLYSISGVTGARFASTDAAATTAATGFVKLSDYATVSPVAEGAIAAASAAAQAPTSAAAELAQESTTTAVIDAAASGVYNSHAVLGEVAAAGLDTGMWGFLRIGIEHMSAFGEMPWWVTLAVGGVLSRLVLLPIVINSQRMTALMAQHKEALGEFRRRMDVARAAKAPQITILAIYREQQDYQKLYGIKPGRTLLGVLAMALVFFGCWRSIYSLLTEPLESMVTGGPSWMPRLTMEDPTHIFPFVSAALVYISLKYNLENPMAGQQVMFPKQMIRFMVNGLPLVALPFTLFMPAGLLFYLIPTQVYGLLQGGLMRLPAMRAWLTRGTKPPPATVPPCRVPEFLALPGEADIALGKVKPPPPAEPLSGLFGMARSAAEKAVNNDSAAQTVRAQIQAHQGKTFAPLRVESMKGSSPTAQQAFRTVTERAALLNKSQKP